MTAKNWAVAIGINQYDYLTPLDYGRQDARAVENFLKNEAKFDRILSFTDDADDKSLRPTRNNLRRVLRQLAKQAKMGAGDNFWFFFSGHGMRHEGRDFLMPCDGEREDVAETAIPTSYIADTLRECGADNVVLLLDACRNRENREKGSEGIGAQTEAEARATGVITLFSCHPNEYSYEIENFQQGAFTKALLEGLGIQRKCATVERLNQYLRHRVPELVRQYRSPKARQNPYTIAEPVTKSHLILLPQYATLADIATLKNDAYRAEVKHEWELAKQLWIRVLAATQGQDIEAVEAVERIALARSGYTPISQPPIPTQTKSASPVLSDLGNSPDNICLESALQELEDPDVIPSDDNDDDDAKAIVAELLAELTPPLLPELSPEPEIELKSDKGVDYRKLQELLQAGKWREADEETSARMLEVMGKVKWWDMEIADIDNFPCADLRTIDRLWVKYSDGRFGFSVQKQIYQNLGGTRELDYEVWHAFGKAVGWGVNGQWRRYSDLSFQLKSPNGHLPVNTFRPYIPSGLRHLIPVLLSRTDL